MPQERDYLAILDYNAGNQTSVHRALTHLGVKAVVTSDLLTLANASGIIFPGVGAAGSAMAVLRENGIDNIIRVMVSQGRPFFGICLGCQIMLDHSDENDTDTLGVIPGDNRRFDPKTLDEDGRPIRVPHMGWNTVRMTSPTPLWKGIKDTDQFYFVHSYMPVPAPQYVLGVTVHGTEFASVIGRDGVWAVQFHPEKSGPPGLRLLRNFHEYCRTVKEPD
jgi:glutamine amidotransferase